MQNKIEDHPLSLMMQMYCSQYSALREENLDINNNVVFHRKYGLQVHVPDWPVLKSVHYITSVRKKNFPKIVVIFSSTEAYMEIFSVLNTSVEYMSWQEIYAGMQMASTDIRDFHKVKGLLNSSDLTFFINPPPLREVIDQVRDCSNGCLIMISEGTN